MTASRAAWAGRVSLYVSTLVAPAMRSVVAQSPPAAPAPGGAAVQAELEAGARHRHPVPLRAGQLLKVEVEQRGIDLALALQGPGGLLLDDIDTVTGLVGPEELRWEATASGEYVLEIRASARAANAG